MPSASRPTTRWERAVAELLTRPVGRPSHKPVVRYKSVRYQAASWTTARRVVAKVEFHCGELFPRVGFIVTTLETEGRAAVRFYNKRGTAEQWIKGRQGGGEADAALVPPVPGERGAAVAERGRLQPGEHVAAARAAEADRPLVADEPAAPSDEDGGPFGQTRPPLLAAPGRRAPDAAAVWGG